MALTADQLKNYGLTSVDGGSEADGVISDGQGNYYKINNFERQQGEGLDTDQGDVFSSSLQKDSGLNVTSFNTINDVQNAVKALSGTKTKPDAPIEHSPQIQEAKERVQTFEREAWDGIQSEDIYGGGNRSLYEGYSDDGGKQQKDAAKSLAQTLAETKKRDIMSQLSNKISV